ncbi:MAG TPA: acyl-CoA dehydrogenase family protein [Streptosporangiaceae bacterium]|nr:acyl-CoA dehydrogenase family protein [Streptosporangiaceae bacterium]
MDELTLIAETVRGILGRVPTDEDAAGWSPSAWTELERAGLTRVGVPEEIGGSGGDPAQTAVVLHAAGYAAAPLPLTEATLLAGRLLARAGIRLPDGPLSAGAGGAAVPAGDGWALSGSVRRVPWGGVAGHVAVLARAEPGPVVALVPARGLPVTPGRNLAGEPRDTLDLSGVRLGGDAAAPVPPDTHESWRLCGALGRVLLMAGAAERTLEMCVRYTRERTQFGRPLARFQAVQHHLARIAAETAALRAAAQAAVLAVAVPDSEPGAGGPGGRAWASVAAAKVRAGRAAGEIAALAHQVHGALGVTWEHGLRRGTTRLWAWRDEFGSETEWAAAIGARVARTGPGALWAALTDDRLPELQEVET